MKVAAFIAFSLALLLAGVARAQPAVPDPDQIVLARNSDRIGVGFVFCICSRSGRGFSTTTASTLLTDLRTVYSNWQADRKKGLANETIIRNAINTAQKAFNACVSRDGYEACVNADFALRPRVPVPYCFYDKLLGRTWLSPLEGS